MRGLTRRHMWIRHFPQLRVCSRYAGPLRNRAKLRGCSRVAELFRFLSENKRLFSFRNHGCFAEDEGGDREAQQERHHERKRAQIERKFPNFLFAYCVVKPTRVD